MNKTVKHSAASLIEMNLGSHIDGSDTNYIDNLIQETGVSSSASGAARPHFDKDPEATQEKQKGKAGRPKSMQNKKKHDP